MRKGFTLVELAIVLVIIGLLIGGVLQGQELIQQAQIRNTVSKLNELDTAINTFRAKYREFPGDITRANAFGVDRPKGQTSVGAINVATTADAQEDGDGDGNLEGAADNTYTDFEGEMANFWVHLANTNLVSGEYVQPAVPCSDTGCNQAAGTGFPDVPIGEGIVALSDNTQLYWIIGTSRTVSDLDAGDAVDDAASDVAGSNNAVTGATLTPEEAYGIDSKVDDGQPDTGTIRAISTYAGSNDDFTFDADGAAVTEDCGFAGEYNLLLDAQACTIRIRASN